MADSFIQLPLDGSGKKVDTDQLTVGANTVERERHRISGSGALEIADVKAAELAVTHYGLGVRAVPKSVKLFNATASASGDNTIVAAVGGKRLKVIWFEIIGTNMTTGADSTWKSGAATTLLGPRAISPGGNWEKQSVNHPHFLFATVAGDALVLNLSAAIGHQVMGAYWDDDAT